MHHRIAVGGGGQINIFKSNKSQLAKKWREIFFLKSVCLFILFVTLGKIACVRVCVRDVLFPSRSMHARYKVCTIPVMAVALTVSQSSSSSTTSSTDVGHQLRPRMATNASFTRDKS